MEVELKLEPGRQEPKVVILAGEDSPSLERLRAHLSGLSLGPITVWRGERALPVRQEEFLRFFADGKGVSAQTETRSTRSICGCTSWRSGWTPPALSASPTVRSSIWTG